MECGGLTPFSTDRLDGRFRRRLAEATRRAASSQSGVEPPHSKTKDFARNQPRFATVA